MAGLSGIGFTDAAAAGAPPEAYKLLTSKQLDELSDKLDDRPGNETLYEAKALPFTVVLTTEQKKSAKEFEWHETRDHILQVLDGMTVYELGGTPVNPRNTKPGEWLAATSDGAQRIVLNEGDMLVIPRGTPHKRSTKESVTFTLISANGTV